MSEAELRVEVVAAPNFVVDSNVESPSSYAPRAAYLGAKFCNDGTNTLTNVIAYIGNYVDGTNDTPGVYPTNRHVAYPEIVGPLSNGTFALTHEGGTLGLPDAVRWVGTLAPGECAVQYWLVGYPNKDVNGEAVWGPSIKPDDDLQLQYDIWITGLEGGVKQTAVETRTCTMRNEISAMANKIFPNTANKVPQEYQDLLKQYSPAWTNVANDGSAGTLIKTEGIWYDLGNIGEGFDNDGDFVPDHNAWMQPVGDPSLFDAGSFRLVRTHVLVVVKLKTGGELVYVADDKLYFQNIPENNGAIGYVAYEFMSLGTGQSSMLTPYQECASGRDNEKFNADYGAILGTGMYSPPPSLSLDKQGNRFLVPPGERVEYTIAFTNTGAVAVGNPGLNLPLVIQDRIPTGMLYVAGSATASNVLPAGVAGYQVVYSTNHALSWVVGEPVPASAVTHLQWWLSDTLATGSYGTVRFGVTVTNPYAGPPLIVNVAGLSVGDTDPFLTDDATNLVAGTNRLGDTVYLDIGAGAYFGNGAQESGEPGVSNITVRLYYDANTNGTLDAADLYLASASTDTNGVYLFTNLPSGRYVAAVDRADPDLPMGYTITTPAFYSALLGPGGTNAFLAADYGFAPALSLNKALISTNAFREGQQVTYALSVSNNLPGNGVGGGAPATYLAWGSGGTADDAEWHNFLNAFTPPGPDGNYASNHFDGATKLLVVSNFQVGVQSGAISNVALLLPIVMIAPTDADDTLVVRVETRIPAATRYYRVFDATGLVSGTLTIPMTGTVAWSWSEFTTNYTVTLSCKKNSGKASGGALLLDAVGFRVTSDQLVGGDAPTTTLNPVPLTDRYDADLLQFVSANPPPSTSTTNGAAPNTVGTLRWNNVGPIYPGGTSQVQVTFRLLEPPANTNAVHTNITWVTNAYFIGGTRANTATSQVVNTLLPAATLGDYVWRDLNGDGLQNETNAGIGNVAVSLTPPPGVNLGNGAGASITNYTDTNGYYRFESIPATGVYTVRVVTATLPGGSGTNTFDEDGVLDGRTAVFLDIYANNTNNTHLTTDYGYRLGSTIEGTVWNDRNRNAAGAPDSGEEWLTNVIVYLYQVGGPVTPIATNRSNTSGYFQFTGSYVGSYVVQVVTNTGMMTNAVWVQSFDTDAATAGLSNRVTVTVAGGGSARGDFSYYQSGNHTIGDQLFYDWNSNGVYEASTEEGVSFITVSLYEDANSNGVVDAGIDALMAMTQTDAGGYYLFTNLPAGTYQVLVDQADAQMPPLYLITADPYGAKDGRSVVTLTTGSNTNQDFGYWPYGVGAIGDTVWLDVNADGVQSGAAERGLSNITVSLYADMNGDGTYVLHSTAVTDPNGKYLFPNLPAGAFKVVVDPTDGDLPKDAFNYTVAPTTATNVLISLPVGVTNLTADFGFAALAAVGDTIFKDINSSGSQDWTEPGITGVIVELYRDLNSNTVYDAGDLLDRSTVTSTNGLYLFAGLTPGRYVVRVDTNSPALYAHVLTADPNNDGLPYGDPNATNYDHQVGVSLLPGTSFMGADFGYRPTGIIGDTVWFDVNTNGVRDAGEIGIPYITLGVYTNGTLVATNATDADGYYFFADLPDGTYDVRVFTNDVDFPPGVTNVYDPDGSRDHAASSIVISNGSIRTVAGMTWTQGDLAIDFGYRYDGSNVLSGTVGMDAVPYDGVMGEGTSGVRPDEAAFAGVTVYAYFWQDTDQDGVLDASERTMIGSTLTDTNGDYRFTGLPNAVGSVTNRYLVSMAPPLGVEAVLTTTNGSTVALNVVNTTNALGQTSGAYQVLAIAPVIENVDFAFAPVGTFDYGDLPVSYGTRMSDPTPGARHVVRPTPNLYLGAAVDVEGNGQPSAPATGDDANGTPDDEDGVTVVGEWRAGSGGGAVRVVVGAGSGWLCGYLDFNHDGDFTETNELFINEAVAAGTSTFSVNVPEGALLATNSTQLYARFRLFEIKPGIPAAAYAGLANNGEVEDYRFDFGALGDTVWRDDNGNGIRDAGEPPLTNVTVFVDGNGNGVRDAGELFDVTGTNGDYSLVGLTGGTYRVTVDGATLPAGLIPTYDAQGFPDGQALMALAAGEVRLDVDFGYRVRGPGAIGDRVWLDEDSDGVQDAGEAGIANVRVSLHDTNGVVLASTLTDSEGEYLFTALGVSTYRVAVDTATLPAGLSANQTFDPDSTTNHETIVTLTAPALTVLTADFGYNWAPRGDVFGGTGTGAIGDRVWIDADGDGRQDPGEPGMGGVTVTLVNLGGDGLPGTADDITHTTTTAADGGYVFDGLAAGAYVVLVNGGTAPAGYTQTGDPDYFGMGIPIGLADNRLTTPILLAPGDVFVNVDFGYLPEAGNGATVGDLVWFDANADGTNNGAEYGLANVTVALIRDSNANGVWDNGEPVIATTLTDANGAYAFTGLPVTDGMGTDDYLAWVNDTGHVLGALTPTYDADGVASANVSAVADLTGAGNLLQDFGYTSQGQTFGAGLIGDTIFLDRNGNGTPEAGEGLQGVTVELYTTNGTLLASATTDANGLYAFGGLSTNDAAYVVRVATNTLPAGVTNAVDPDGGVANESTATLTGASPVNLAQDFGYRAAVDNAIAGTVWEDVNADGTLTGSETGRLAGVSLALYDTNGNVVARTSTDGGGDYSFTGLPAGTYRVDVTDRRNVLNGWWHSDGANDGADSNSQDDAYTVTVAGGETNRTADFGYFVQGGAVGNRTWFDADGDGVQEGGETGLSNVVLRVQAVYANGATTVVSTVSGGDGAYRFGGLLLDENFITNSPHYDVSVVSIPAGYFPVPKYVSTNAWVDSGNLLGQPVAAARGLTDVGLQADPNDEPLQGSYDFGFDNVSTLAVISGFRAYTAGGRTWVQWETAAELGTVGYYLDRLTVDGWVGINPELVVADETEPLPHVYEVEDGGVASGETHTWRIVELDDRGRLNVYGPYTVTVDGIGVSYEEWAAEYFRSGHAAIAARDADPDRDGLTNFEEYLAGTDPTDRNSVLRVTGVTSRSAVGETVLRWGSEAGRAYTLEFSTNLLDGFLPIESGISAVPPDNVHTVRLESATGTLYFRVVAE